MQHCPFCSLQKMLFLRTTVASNLQARCSKVFLRSSLMMMSMRRKLARFNVKERSFCNVQRNKANFWLFHFFVCTFTCVHFEQEFSSLILSPFYLSQPRQHLLFFLGRKDNKSRREQKQIRAYKDTHREGQNQAISDSSCVCEKEREEKGTRKWDYQTSTHAKKLWSVESNTML